MIVAELLFRCTRLYHIIQREEIGDLKLAVNLVLHNICPYTIFLWHHVVSYLILGHFVVYLIFLHLLMIQLMYRRQILLLHSSDSSL